MQENIDHLLSFLESHTTKQCYASTLDLLWFLCRLFEDSVVKVSAEQINRLIKVTIQVLLILDRQMQHTDIAIVFHNGLRELAKKIFIRSQHIDGADSKLRQKLERQLDGSLKTNTNKPVITWDDFTQLDWQDGPSQDFHQFEKKRNELRMDLNQKVHLLPSELSQDNQCSIYLKTMQCVEQMVFPWFSSLIYQRSPDKKDVLAHLSPLEPLINGALPFLIGDDDAPGWELLHVYLHWMRDQSAFLLSRPIEIWLQYATASLSHTLVAIAYCALSVDTNAYHGNEGALLTLCQQVVQLERRVSEQIVIKPPSPTLFNDHRETLKRIRKIWQISADYSIAEKQQTFSEDSIDLMRVLLQESVSLLGEPPGKFALLFLGSSSRHDRLPYSDIECALMYEAAPEQAFKMRSYLYTLLSLLEFAIIRLGETQTFGQKNPNELAGFELDESEHLLNYIFLKQLNDNGDTVFSKEMRLIGTVEELYERHVAARLFQSTGDLVFAQEGQEGRGVLLYAMLTPLLVNQTWGGQDLFLAYQAKVKLLLDKPTDSWAQGALKSAYFDNQSIQNPDPMLAKKADRLEDLSSLDNKKISPIKCVDQQDDSTVPVSFRQLIALYCWADILRQSEKSLRASKKGLINLKDIHYKPLVYSALNLQLFLGASATHPSQMFEAAYAAGILSFKLKQFLQEMLTSIVLLRSRLQCDKKGQEGEVLLSALLPEEQILLEMMERALLRPLKTVTETLLSKTKNGFEHITNISPGLVLEPLIESYFLNDLQSCKAPEDYQNWFIDISLYGLYTQSPLETHRSYYRLLPEDQRKSCLKVAEDYFAEKKDKGYWHVETSFWEKLWDAPLPDGSRKKHIDEKIAWYQKLSALVTHDTDVLNETVKVHISSLTLGQHMLKKNIVNDLLTNAWIDKSGKFADKDSHPVARDMAGNHLVIPWPSDNPQFYFKVYPEYPLVELFLNELSRRLGYYSPREVDVWLWRCGRYDYPVMVSQAVSGPTLKVALEKNLPFHFDPYALSQSVLISAFAHLEDNKPDNSVLMTEGKADRLYLVDADRWFVPAFKQHKLQTKDILFCLPEMSSTIDVLFQEEFLSLNPEQVLTAWLKEVDILANECIKVFGAKIEDYFLGGWLAKETEKSCLLPPLKFHAVQYLFNQMQLAQEIFSSALNEKTKITHWQLLFTIDRRLEKHYHSAFDAYKTPLERFKEVAGHAYPAGKSMIDMKTQMQDMWEGLEAESSIRASWKRDIAYAKDQLEGLQDSQLNLDVTKQAMLKGSLERFQKLPLASQQKILEKLDWSKLPEKKIQRNLLRHLINRGRWLKLTLLHSDEVNDNDLQILLKKSPSLTHLIISNCQNLSEDFLAGMPQKEATLQIINFEQLPKIRYLGYRAGIFYAEKYFVFPNLQQLSITDCRAIEQINLKADVLEKCVTTHCQQLEHIEISCPDLQYLVLEDCTALSNSIQFIQKTPKLTHLNIGQTPEWLLGDILTLNPMLKHLTIPIIPENDHSTLLTLKRIQQKFSLLKSVTLHHTSYGIFKVWNLTPVSALSPAKDHELVKVPSGVPQIPIDSTPVNRGSIVPSVFYVEPKRTKTFADEVKAMSKAVSNKIDAQSLTVLFKWVTEGHLIEVEKLLKKTPILVLVTGTVTDLSDRTFKEITILQYAAWTLDTEMCELIIQYLDAHSAVVQLKALESEPKRYSEFGSHYDMTPLITKTQSYVDNYRQWGYYKCCQYWQKEVGGEQRKCPAWFIYAWCETGSDVAWTMQDFNRKINRQYGKNWPLWWMTEGGGVGTSWAVWRGRSQQMSRDIATLSGESYMAIALKI